MCVSVRYVCDGDGDRCDKCADVSVISDMPGSRV